MIVNSKALFAFNRTLPTPFENTNKKQSVASKYTSASTHSTLSASVIKAVHAYIDCQASAGKGGVGVTNDWIVAEYKSAVSNDAYHIVAYNVRDGQLYAGEYDRATELLTQYVLTDSKKDGSAVHMAMMPSYLSDDEFKQAYDAYCADRTAGYPDMDAAASHMALMCDNAYRRIVDETTAAHVKLKVERSGNISRITTSQIDSGKFRPDTVIAGEFVILTQSGPASLITPSKAIDHADFLGKYVLNPGRVYNVREQMLIPKLPEWYILPAEVVSICKHAQWTGKSTRPMRNFLLRGPAGTGKTEGAKAIAAGLNLPYVKFTCSANTEIFDMIGQVFPDTAAATTGDAALDEERKMLIGMGGINFENVSRLMKLPDMDDMEYDPAGVYQAVTGNAAPQATPQDCMRVVMERVTDKIRLLSQTQDTKEGQSYIYVETDFIRALKHGYLIEIQEPAVIMQPGVLVGLNSLLEQTGSITLPTGEIIQRHPEAVVVITTNTSYEGCRNLNQSIIDRMSLVQDVELPAPEVMAQRAMSITGCEDNYMVSEMVTVVNAMSVYMRQNGISDGSCGMRSLIDWITSAMITGDAYSSAMYTVISKATADMEDRQALIDTVLNQNITKNPLKQAV